MFKINCRFNKIKFKLKSNKLKYKILKNGKVIKLMPSFLNFSKNDLENKLSELKKCYFKFQQKKLKLDLSRGKPSTEQLALSNAMLENLNLNSLLKLNDSFDARNYGSLTGIYKAKEFFANILKIPPEMIIIGGNSSLKLMFDYINLAMNFGILENKPWNKLNKVKFLCPCPGYDRHFAICELFQIEMIPISMKNYGPDMKKIKILVENDSTIKGIWCVPKYSNPTGITYSDETVRKFAELKPAAPDFRIFWDNAYVVHHLTSTHDKLLNIFEECKKLNNENLVIEFASTSKITFPGGGISAIAASLKNIENITKIMSKQTIGYNKINQLIHCNFLNSTEKLQTHMKNHAKIIKPKFDLVIQILEKKLKYLNSCTWTKPNGGYFISFESEKNCAKRIFDLCMQAGLILTEVGATYPYKNDPNNSNIRIAPTFPNLKELKIAMNLFCICVEIATIEKKLNK